MGKSRDNSERDRANLIRLIAREEGFGARVDEIDSEIYRWILSAPRSSRFCKFFRSMPRLNIELFDPHIDEETCIALDHARAGGSPRVVYPGLGELPFGSDLARTVARIAEIKAEPNLFDGKIIGFHERTWILYATKIGVFELSRSPSSKETDLYRKTISEVTHRFAVDYRSDDETEPDGAVDSLYFDAVNAVRDIQQISVPELQRIVRIGYNRAVRLLAAMEVRGVVSAPDSGGIRKVLEVRQRAAR